MSKFWRKYNFSKNFFKNLKYEFENENFFKNLKKYFQRMKIYNFEKKQFFKKNTSKVCKIQKCK